MEVKVDEEFANAKEQVTYLYKSVGSIVLQRIF